MNGEVGRGGKRRDNISRRETSSRWSKFLDLYLYMKRTCGSTVTTNRAAAMAEWLNWASETKRINIERYCMYCTVTPNSKPPLLLCSSKNKAWATKLSKKCDHTNLEKQPTYRERVHTKKRQHSKLQNVKIRCTGLENGHLRIAMDAMQHTLCGVFKVGPHAYSSKGLPNASEGIKTIILVRWPKKRRLPEKST